MSKRQSQMMRRRWKNREYKRRVAAHIRVGVRRSLRLTVKTNRAPDLRRDIPDSVLQLIDTCTDECCEITSCEPMRVNRETLWCVVLIDGSDDRLKERYHPLVEGHGLSLYEIHSRPLYSIGGVAVVLIVGLSKGEA